MKFRLTILLSSILLLNSCVHSRYYRKVSDNIQDFEVIATHLKQSKRSSNEDCIYNDTADSLSKKFMEEYQLKRICISVRNDKDYNTAITFHRSYNPFFGKADVIYYDFGKSGLRTKIEAGKKTKGEKLKSINDTFIYALYSKPAFGF